MLIFFTESAWERWLCRLYFFPPCPLTILMGYKALMYALELEYERERDSLREGCSVYCALPADTSLVVSATAIP